MWLFTKIGFYSVSVSRIDPEVMQIRARARVDLEKMQSFIYEYCGFDPGDILETPGADYKLRLLIPRHKWGDVALALASEVNYSNFKAQIKDHERHKLYARVWGAMLALEYQGQYSATQPDLWKYTEPDELAALLDDLELNGEQEPDWVDALEEADALAQVEKGALDDLDDPNSPFYDPGRHRDDPRRDSEAIQ